MIDFMDRRAALKAMGLAVAAPALPAPKARTIALPIVQVEPLETRVVRHPVPGGYVTGIYREWAPGQAALCRLCPRGECSAERDACLIAVDGFVAPGKAAMYDATGHTIVK